MVGCLSQEWRGILRILSNFSKGVYQVGCLFLGSSREWQSIIDKSHSLLTKVFLTIQSIPGKHSATLEMYEKN